MTFGLSRSFRENPLLYVTRANLSVCEKFEADVDVAGNEYWLFVRDIHAESPSLEQIEFREADRLPTVEEARAMLEAGR